MAVTLNPGDIHGDDLKSRLAAFVTYFVEQLEDTLHFAYGLLEKHSEKNIKKSTASRKAVNSKLTGVLLHLLAGNRAKELRKFPVVLIPPKLSGIGVEVFTKLLDNYKNETDTSKATIKLMELVYAFIDSKSLARELFVRIGIDIFYGFEFQFMRVTTPLGSEKAMQKLAQEAANRLIRSIQTNSDYIQLNAERVCQFTINKDTFKSETYESKLKYTNENFEAHCNISKMYENIGIAISKEGSKAKYDFYVKKGKAPNEFGYRRLFRKEFESCIQTNYDLITETPKSYTIPRYIKDRHYYSQLFSRLLRSVNEMRRSSNSERNLEMFLRVKNVLLQEISHMRRKNDLDDEFRFITNSVESLINQFSINECFREIDKIETKIKNLEEIKKTNTNQQVTNNKVSSKFCLFPPVSTFTGREIYLNDLHTTLHGSGSSNSRMVCVSGLGGIGKTELAKKYAKQYESYYKNIVFINAETKDTIQHDFKLLAINLEISLLNEENKRKDIKLIIEEIFGFFQEMDNNTLLFLDDASDFKDIEDIFPKLFFNYRKLYVLITSQRRDWDVVEGVTKVISLDVLTKVEAVDYVNTVLELKNRENDYEVNKLIERLHFLPLALRQATAFIKRKPGSVKFAMEDYLNSFEHQYHLVMDDGYYSKCIKKTWDVTLKKIRDNDKNGKLALKIFQIMAYLSPDLIDMEKVFCKQLAGEKKLELYEAVNLLVNYSMINRINENTVAIHPLVQDVTRYVLKMKKKEEDVIKNTLKLLEDCGDEHLVLWENGCGYPSIIKILYDGKFKETLLPTLARNKNGLETIKSLLKHVDRSIIEGTNANGETPLYIAAENGNLNTIAYLLSEGANIHTTNKLKCTALHAAAQNDHDEVVDYLIRRDTNEHLINALTTENKYPLDCAIEINNTSIIRMLVSRNNPVHLHRALGYVLLQETNDICHLLILETYKQNPPVLNSTVDGKSICHIVANNEYLLETLVLFDIDINVPDSDGNVGLHIGASKGNVNSSMIFLKYGADPNSTNNKGETPLHLAANVDICQLLLESGACINSIDNSGNTVLHFSASRNKPDLFTYQINKGCDPNVANLDGYTPFDLPFINYHDHDNSIRFFKLVMNIFKERNLSSKDKNGNTPLHLVCNKDQNIEKIVQMLLNEGLDIDERNDFGETPLYCASKRNNYETFICLLNNGADPNIPNKWGKTPLHIATRQFCPDNLKKLLFCGVNANAADIHGRTPLHIAVKYRNREIIECLLLFGANPDVADSDGKIPLYYALRSENNELATLLLGNM